jgi:hypothetical protein
MYPDSTAKFVDFVQIDADHPRSECERAHTRPGQRAILSTPEDRILGL